MTPIIVLTTVGASFDAKPLAINLVEKRLAACVNVIPRIHSVYRWQGKIEQEDETMVLFKTTAARFAAFEEKLKSLHPYDVPEIICAPIASGWPPYLEWVRENVKS